MSDAKHFEPVEGSVEDVEEALGRAAKAPLDAPRDRTALSEMRVAVLATDGVEESELTEPVRALREAGVRVCVLSLRKEPIQAFRHHDKSLKIRVDRALKDAKPEWFDALVLPGGALNADVLRAELRALRFVREIAAAGKPIAAICHAPWILASAGLVRGRTLTGYHTLRDDLKNAGANWVNGEVVIDGNWVTSRGPRDLPAFNRAFLDVLSRMPTSAAA